MAARACVALAVSASLLPLTATTASADTKPPKDAAQGWQQKKTKDTDRPGSVPPQDRAVVLGKDYAKSPDTAWTTSGDSTGFHLLIADEKDGYTWKTAATLSEDGFNTDTWVGNACVTASGKHAAIAYAPRTFTNKPELMVRGAFTAVVDLKTGKITKLPYQAALTYFSPGCGHGEDAVFTQLTHDGDEKQQTRLVTVDTETGKTAKPVTLPGQVTSAIPTRNGIVAAQGNRLVRVHGSTMTELARTTSVPFQLKTDNVGGVTFIDRTPEPDRKNDGTSEAKHLTAGQISKGKAKPTTLAGGRLTDWDLATSASGTTYITGTAKTTGKLPATVKNPGGIAKDAVISTRGKAAATTAWADGKDSRIRPEEALTARTARTRLHLLATGKNTVLDAHPGDPIGGPAAQKAADSLSPALKAKNAESRSRGTGQPKAASPTDPVEAERYCSVPRNHVRKQAFQPTPRQAEWAVDQAVVGKLNLSASRDENWKYTGMQAYKPQTLFPPIVLVDDPNGVVDDDKEEWHIPAQILLGITAQESNMQQAEGFAVPGVTANSKIGNYYGVKYAADGEQPDPWGINWDKADCGYGITQVTDGMRVHGKEKPDEKPKTTVQQEAIALDYAANIAAGAQVLSEKWNDTYKAGMKVNGGKPKYIENWFFALWAYNSGFYPQGKDPDGGAHWGLGWTNNPANPLWKANRLPFLEGPGGGDDYSHAAHPQDWPYEEKVIGWAARPIAAAFKPGDMQPGYRAAWWNGIAHRTTAKPPVDLFCDASNNCDPGKISDGDSNDPGKGACNLAGNAEGNHWLHCWWNKEVKWKDCGSKAQCGNPIHRFDGNFPEQPDANSYPPSCYNTGLPSGALIVDNLPNGADPAGSGSRSCGRVASDGTFGFTFTKDGDKYPGKMDLNQIGAGYGNHFWFSHTRTTQDEDYPNGKRLKITGKWTLNRSAIGWARVLVHIPDHGAHTRQAAYTVGGSDSKSPTRHVQQRIRKNAWVSIGVFNFTGKPTVSLSTDTRDGRGTEDVAWDAVAFQKFADKPDQQIVAMGDSYSSGEGASEGNGSYYPETNYKNDQDKKARNACHRSKDAWSRQAALPSQGSTSIGELEDSFSQDVSYKLVACSGARTYNIVHDTEGNGEFDENGEAPQIDQGYLDQHTTLVTLSVGGNDTRFTYVFQKCLLQLGDGDCRYDKFDDVDKKIDESRQKPFQGMTLEKALLGDTSQPSGPKRDGLIQNIVRPDIVKAMKEVHAKAPNAKILLMGYPELITGDAGCLRTGFDQIGMSPASAEWLNNVANRLAMEMDNAVDEVTSAGIKARFVDPDLEFHGKAICGSPESVHGIVTDLVGSDEPFDLPLIHDATGLGVSAQSFHPKIRGARLYADAFESGIRNWDL
ncbi:NocE [Streptomyces sp. P1-3]|uniref:golvesin C-terminal-like domain-containing protein n=1 Tax=Streptomyces sp. P1-3 TaxID=3421658 RepID=UPI003D35B7F0